MRRALGALLTGENLEFPPDKQVRAPGSASTHLFENGAVGGAVAKTQQISISSSKP